MAEEVKTPQIMQAALYKNGYSAMIRKVELDADGDTMIGSITPAVAGTFWVYGSPGLKLDSIVNTTVTDKTEVTANSIPGILALNKGATVTLEARGKEYTGKLIETNSVVILETADGMIVLPMADITRAVIQGKAKLTSEATTSTNGLRVKANGKGTLYLLSVEPGLDWVPMYWVDILDNTRLKLTMRTSVTNSVGELKAADLSFVAGSPNMPFIGQNDPFTLISIAGRQGGFGGGVGGGPGGRPSAAMQNTAPPGMAFDMESAFETGAPTGDSIGELFFYKRQKVDLKAGEKGYFVLFETPTTYTTKYTLEVPAREVGESALTTWQTIKFKNNSGVPLTSAVATAYRDTNLIGQDELKYTPAGAEGSLRLARAVDIPGKFTVSELSSDTVVVNTIQRQRVVRAGKIEVQNTKQEAVEMEVSTAFAGEHLSSDNTPEVRKLAERLTELNPTTRIKWSITLKPGEKRSLGFTYRQVL